MSKKKHRISSLQRKNQKLAKTKFDERCLIVCDLDGTLLDKNCNIRSYSRKVIKTLSKQGHIFCILTARPERSSKHYYQQLGLHTPLVNYNGAKMFNPTTQSFSNIDYYINNEIIFKIFNNKEVRKLTDNVIFETPDGTFFLYKFKKGMTVDDMKRSLVQFNIYTTDDVTIMNENIRKLRFGAYAILVSLKDMTKGKEFADAVNKICDSVVVRSWTEEHVGCIIEINSIFPSKGMALRFLSAYYDIPLSRCYSFGDNENDAEMIMATDHGYVMKNGVDIVKRIAKNITDYTNDEEGVARQLNKIFNLQIKYKGEEEIIKDLFDIKK